MRHATVTTTARAGLSLLLLGAAGAAAEPARYELDPAHTTVAFLVEHVGYASTLGQFLEVSGGYTFDAATDEVTALRVEVATKSVDTHHDARDRHLRSGDFFASGEHPTMTFVADGAQRMDDERFVVTGELTLLGITRPLTLEATLNKRAPYPMGDRAEVMGVSARGALKRSEFGMTYGVADNLVGDTVELIVELEARRQAGPEAHR